MTRDTARLDNFGRIRTAQRMHTIDCSYLGSVVVLGSEVGHRMDADSRDCILPLQSVRR